MGRENFRRRLHPRRHRDAQHVARGHPRADAVRRAARADAHAARGANRLACRRIPRLAPTKSTDGSRSRFRSTRPVSRRFRFPTDSAKRDCRSRFKSSDAPGTKPASSRWRLSSNARARGRISIQRFKRPHPSSPLQERGAQKVHLYRRVPLLPVRRLSIIAGHRGVELTSALMIGEGSRCRVM